MFFTPAGLAPLSRGYFSTVESRAEWRWHDLYASSVDYFLIGAIPWREISRSARSATPACSPKASRRIRSWQGWQMPPLKASEGSAQIMHFLVASLMDGTIH
jgi:hypothetical protein